MHSGTTRFGITLMVAYALAMVLCDSIAKELSSIYMVVSIVWYRYVFHTISLSILSGFYYLKFKEPERIGSHPTQILRGVTLVLSTLAFFTSIASMPLAEAMALLYIFPVVAVILSIIFLKERLRRQQVIPIICGFIGVTLVLNPSESINVQSGIYALIGGVLMGVYMFLTKTMTKGSTPIISSIYTGIIGITCIPLFPGFEWVIFEPGSFLLGALMGTFAGIGHFCMFLSMRYAPASVASPFAFAEILFASIAGYIWFGDTLNLVTLMGIVLVVISGIFFAIYSNAESSSQTTIKAG